MTNNGSKVDERTSIKSEKGTCNRCGITAPIGCQDLNMPFILPNEKHMLCNNCIENLAIKEEAYVLELEERLQKQVEENQKAKLEGAKVKTKVKTSNVLGGSSNDTDKDRKTVTITKIKPLPKIQTLESHVLKYIIGQNTQVRSIITAIYRARMFQSIKANVLVIGKSGTGKTETLKQIAAKLNMPYTIEDATKYTEEGYYGNDVTDMVINLLENADYDLVQAENGMLIIDEIDKKASSEISGRDVSGVSVLKSLLKIIEGTKIQVPFDFNENAFDYDVQDFDTSKLIVFFMGAFSGLDKIREKRLRKNTIGFTNGTNDSKPSVQRYIKKDLIDYGMPEEFVGRIDTIVEMNSLNEDTLVEILTKSKLSAFKRYQAALKEKGVQLSFDKELFRLIAKEALAVDTGARELSNVVNQIYERLIYDILANPGSFSKCKLLLDIVQDNTKYNLS